MHKTAFKGQFVGWVKYRTKWEFNSQVLCLYKIIEFSDNKVIIEIIVTSYNNNFDILMQNQVTE